MIRPGVDEKPLNSSRNAPSPTPSTDAPLSSPRNAPQDYARRRTDRLADSERPAGTCEGRLGRAALAAAVGHRRNRLHPSPHRYLAMELLLQTQDIRLSYGQTLSLTMIGLASTLFMPGSVGGDLVKAYYVTKDAANKRPQPS